MMTALKHISNLYWQILIAKWNKAEQTEANDEEYKFKMFRSRSMFWEMVGIVTYACCIYWAQSCKITAVLL